MPSELYACGVNRIIYKAQDFATGLTVTAYFWNPALAKSALQTFTEIELGLYYLDYDFVQAGTHAALFYEDSVKKTMGAFRVAELALEASLTDIKGTGFVKDTHSLVQCAAAAGGDATAANQTTIINHLTDVKGTDFVKDTHSLKQIRDYVQRILGLTQENHYIDNTIFETGKLKSARIRIYSVAGSVGTDVDVIATYNITVTYDANGNMETYKVVKA